MYFNVVTVLMFYELTVTGSRPSTEASRKYLTLTSIITLIHSPWVYGPRHHMASTALTTEAWLLTSPISITVLEQHPLVLLDHIVCLAGEILAWKLW